MTRGFTQSTRSPRNGVFLRALRVLRAAFVGWLISWGHPAAAHDAEHTQVALTFSRDGSFVLDVANDPNWLKLRMAPFHGNFADRIVLWVDGREIRPASVELIAGDGLSTYRLRGRMPIDAKSLRWFYGLVVDPYPLTIRRADGRVVLEEVQGDAWSGPIDLSGQFTRPLLSERTVMMTLVGLLMVPIAIRVRTVLPRRSRK